MTWRSMSQSHRGNFVDPSMSDGTSQLGAPTRFRPPCHCQRRLRLSSIHHSTYRRFWLHPTSAWEDTSESVIFTIAGDHPWGYGRPSQVSEQSFVVSRFGCHSRPRRTPLLRSTGRPWESKATSTPGPLTCPNLCRVVSRSLVGPSTRTPMCLVG